MAVFSDYPNPEAEAVTLRLEKGGFGTGGLDIAAGSEQGTETLIDNFSFSGATLAKAEWTRHRLLYSTPKLSKAVHLSGTPTIKIKVAFSKPAGNLSGCPRWISP